MPNYLLSCDCGQTHSVGATQAGGQVVCPCGKPLDVPPLRQLRHLPQATVDQGRPATTWSTRHGTIAVCAILAGLLVGLSLWSRFNEPTFPTFDPAAHSQMVAHEVNRWTPVEAWRFFIDVYRPMAERGFVVMESPDTPAIRTEITKQRFYQTVMLAVAAILAIAALAIALWTGAKRGRQGD